MEDLNKKLVQEDNNFIKEYVEDRKRILKNEFSKYYFCMTIRPLLVIIQVGENAASQSYIKGKLKDAKELLVDTKLIKLNENISEKKLEKIIKKLNKKRSVNGILVQMPLPKHINEFNIKKLINPLKDVDGFNAYSKVNPCTPQGIINYLKYIKYDFKNKNALVIGRSNIVGKPMAELLTQEDCNVTVVHSKTSEENLKHFIENSDLIICAVGKTHFLNNKYNFKKDAFIFDVGINRENEKLCGDCDKNLSVKYQSPVPGGVGLLTRLNVFENLNILLSNVYEK